MFCAVAHHGSVAAAAQEISLTPSALSHALRGLETEIGCRLFDREGKRMVLNPAGEELLARVQEPMAALNLAADAVRNLGKWGQTRLRIGAAATICQILLPPVIRELKKLHPGLILQVESGDMPELLEATRTRQIDLAVGVAQEPVRGMEIRPLFEDEMLPVFAPTHPWADGRPLTRDELKSQPLILYQRRSFTGGAVDDFFRGLNFTPSAIMEIGSITAIKEMVKLGLGVSVLSPWVAERELARGVLKMRPFGTRMLRRRWVLAHLTTHKLGMAEESFCRLCRGQAASLPLDRKDLPERGRVK
jgi:DNA-binding transcriptional LysR family regulator